MASKFEQVVVPSLRHINMVRCGSEDKSVVQAMKRTIKSLRTNKKVCLHGRGKQPICSFDVAALISRIPESMESNLQDASLFLFALQSGPRLWRFIIILRITKGNPTWDHPACIEGFPDRENPLDVVFYLNQFAIRILKDNLIHITKREKGPNLFDRD